MNTNNSTSSDKSHSENESVPLVASFKCSKTLCIFCSTEVPPAFVIERGKLLRVKEEMELNSFGCDDFVLAKQLRAVNIMRNILDISEETCWKILVQFDGQYNPEFWVKVCGSCKVVLEDYNTTKREISRLQWKAKQLKEKLKGFISTSNQDDELDVDSTVWREIREEVLAGLKQTLPQNEPQVQMGIEVGPEFRVKTDTQEEPESLAREESQSTADAKGESGKNNRAHNNRRHPKQRESSDGDEPECSGNKSGATNHVAIAAKNIKGGKRAAKLIVVGGKTQKKTILKNKKPIVKRENSRKEESTSGRPKSEATKFPYPKKNVTNHTAIAAKIIKGVKRAATLVAVGDKTQKKVIPKNKKPIVKREISRNEESTSGNEKRGGGRSKSVATKLPLSCPHCPFRCVIKTLAETHRRLHEEGASFVACQICGVFLQPRTQALASHNGRCHPKHRESSDVKEPEGSGWKSGVHYACHLCPFKGQKGTWAENHRRLHEQGAAAVICPVCKWYVSSSALAVHHARRHGTARDSSTPIAE